MKFFTLLLIALLSLSMAYAQTAQPPVFDNKLPTPAIPPKIFFPAVNAVSTANNTGERSVTQPRSGTSVYDSIYAWELNSAAWDVSTKIIDIVYDANNNLTSEVLQSWHGSTWVDSIKTTYTYNLNNLEISDLYQTWSGSSWVNNTKDTIIYNSGNSITSETSQMWSGSAWVNNYQYIYTFNSNNLDSISISQTWSGSAWQNNDLYSWAYNSKNLDTSEMIQIWSGGVWVNYQLNTITYNSNNLQTSVLLQQWVNYWLNYNLTTYAYNSGNDVDSSVVFIDEAPSNSGPWRKYFQSTYTYNANNIELSEVDEFVTSTGDTITGGDSTYYYLQTNAGIDILSDNSAIKLYPTPATDILHTDIQLKQTENLQLRLVNIVGQTVWSADAGHVSSYQNGISVAGLVDGVYLLEMVTGGGMETKEVVVER